MPKALLHPTMQINPDTVRAAAQKLRSRAPEEAALADVLADCAEALEHIARISAALQYTAQKKVGDA